MYLRIRRLARQLNSPTLTVAARDYLSDTLSSAAALGGTLGSAFLHPLLDPAAGFAVALWIFRAAYEAGKENLDYLTGAGAEPETRKVLAAAAADVPGVLRVHQVITEYVGPRLVVDLHVNVDGTLTLYEAHEIADQVQERLEALADVDRAYVHVEPYEEETKVSE
jgi:cation diffusion facilitator family transporter